MIFHIPHASRVIPIELRSTFLLNEQQLGLELLRMTDAYVDKLFGPHARLGDSVIMYPVSRLVVDPERFLNDEDEEMAGVGMGVIYTKTSFGDRLRETPTTVEREALIRKYYVPHHKRLEAAVIEELNQTGKALILDCHSFPSRPLPYESDQNLGRSDICIGTDTFHTPSSLWGAAQLAAREQALSCGINRPFFGTLTPNRFYRKDKKIYSIMIEVNRRLYMNEETGEKNRGFKVCQKRMGPIVNTIRAELT